MKAAAWQVKFMLMSLTPAFIYTYAYNIKGKAHADFKILNQFFY